ncbi:hypothetical protein J421_2842 [Gemmatirosa kalamazoonensis]|uniref:Uncharacterized protein n=1 Tax=Gemmatirosa kalamazoonensis TaxID=861299 RepID=W0RGZ4_9BACT|nr:hypothetical protein [Gemmatirosa kalamazoonensis]AHG90379.1 hypothetical protein J421_2842 [Gemmatirosa kalamazoonensis]
MSGAPLSATPPGGVSPAPRIPERPPAPSSPVLPHQGNAVRERRERVRVYYLVLGAAAILVALLSLWQLLHR